MSGSNVRPHILQKIEKALNEISYRDAIVNSSQYNNRLVSDRKTRMPFLDAQTGVAQRDCFLWMQKWERMPGNIDGQLYTYPSRRWKKKRRGYLLNDNYFFKRSLACENQESNHANGVESSIKSDNSESIHKLVEGSTKTDLKDAWVYSEYDDSFDFEVDFDDPESDYDDSEEFSIGRKKKRKKESIKKKKIEHGDADKPFICDICDARYKTRPGLSYHYTHVHQNAGENDKNSRLSEDLKNDDDSRHSKSSSINANSNSAQNPPNSTNTTKNGQESSQNTSGASSNKDGDKPVVTPSPYCDFCLGDSEENKKSKSAEKLVSCSDCGRSAHPTCLQFTPQMIISIQKYRWQCIECKSCGLCGTSDNDEQLLFCDDCDRGYHMYCLNPPLSEPPEGSWSCFLCIEQYHTPKKKTEN